MTQRGTTECPDTESNDHVDVGEVRRNWRTVEDGSVAHVLQQAEFSQHFDQNRCERRNMQVDTRLCKAEQKLEDEFSEEYRAQVRLDIEKEDERLARELQYKLEEEENENKLKLMADDEQMARKLQAAINSSAPHGPLPEVHFEFPSIIPDDVCATIQRAHDRSESLTLPANLNVTQLKAIHNVVKEYNPRMAQEVKDHELALRLSSAHVTSEQQSPEENSQNARRSIDKQWKNVLQREVMKNSSDMQQHSERKSLSHHSSPNSAPNPDHADLISFDDDHDQPINRSPNVAFAGSSTAFDPIKTSNGFQPRLIAGRGQFCSPTPACPSGGGAGHGKSRNVGVSVDNVESYGRAYGSPAAYGLQSVATQSPRDSTSPSSAYVNASGVKVIPRSALQ